MSLDQCLPGLIAKGGLDPKRGKEAADLYGELYRRFRGQYGDEAAAAMASQETILRLGQKAAEKKRIALLQVQRQSAIMMDLKAGGPSRAPVQLERVALREGAIKMRARMMMDELLHRHRTTISGKARNPAELEDIVRELFGEDTGNLSAKELADAWTRAADMLRGRFNQAGGAIGKLERWGLPQSHDAMAVREAGYRAWRDYLLPRLDRARMIDDRTGQPFGDEALELTLRDVFETIRTDGWSKITPGAAGGKMLAKQKADHRFLHFASADDWLAYQERFGSGTAFDAMMGHVASMSRDTALMEILGPNPAATMRWLKDSIEKQARLGDGPGAEIEAADKAASLTQDLYDEITGALRRPVSHKLASFFSGVRSIQTSAKLGAATLSAVTDVSFGAMTRRFNGLPMLPMITGYLKQLNPASAADRKQAIRLLGIAEEEAHVLAASNRYLNEELTGEWQSRLASGVLRISGLNALTGAGRKTFGLEFLGHLTDESVKPWDKLDPAFRATLERGGIGADGWERIRKTPLEVDRGVPWIKPENIEDQALGDKLLEIIHHEIDFAVPTADLRTRAWLNQGMRRGTWKGELLRSAFQFKSFGISIVMTQARRIAAMSAGNGARYAAGLFIAMTIGGLVALQLKEISKGRDPRPLVDADGNPDPELWGAAILQGGGLGIFGDFLGSAENRYGGGIASTLAGPLTQTVQNVGDATLGNVYKAARGDKTDVGADIVKIVKQETPGGSLWYSRLALERLVLDQLQEAIDPNYAKSWSAMEKRAAERGQEFFWEPGQEAPQRAPDLGNLGGVE